MYLEGADPLAHLDGAADGRPNRQAALEELLLLWVANQNPAFMRYDELFDDRGLAASTAYPSAVDGLRRFSKKRAARSAGGEDVIERLLAPGRMAPDSLSDQLRWIRDNWAGDLDADLLGQLTLDLDVLTEEEVGARRAFERFAGGPGAGVAGPGLHAAGATAADEPDAFSMDRDWMPELVLLAKSTYVWLDQLSRTYGRAIRTLDAIPDEELERLRAAGFTGLWLIGLWERSHASQRIKQLRGNPEAVASAYSLLDYRIADDLGGEQAWANLRERAWARGIRLASDMVPNHMGIDARWVREHPDWFIGRDEPPFPSYTFNGPNLSSDERVGIYLEDHYYDGTDAAVVFKRVDRWSGATRYLYHGNDGTSFPWNDTAQLDYLRAEVREAVIRTILEVARRFPVIRFDAAMVLAKRHVQRLWYPLPGEGGAIPSRAESALSAEAFERLMPVEFWREVVDRVAAEAPDTLLLAEAFWMLEGYFVRTLGMHRVYNSAFMHMLRDEQNAEYRGVIRETVAFDARILGRYVNFMNNPDERTAIDQFGAGDKYVGVATLLVTMPGLPMFGHGQVEGFGEKYGMEFRRARLEETPDPELLARHERDIFPLLRQRWRFAGSDEFRLLDAVTGEGGVDEDVFAYTNHAYGARSLVVYRNKYAEGRVRLVGAGAALGVPDDGDGWLILRDARSGLEFLRNAHDLNAVGLEIDLHAYTSHVFLDPELVRDGPSHDWARLAWRIGLSGLPDVRAALQEQLLAPVRDAVAGLFTAQLVRDVAGAAMAATQAGSDALLADAVSRAEGALARIAESGGRGGGSASASVWSDDGGAPERRSSVERRLSSLVALAREGRRPGGPPGARRLMTWLTARRDRWATILGWALAASLGEAAGDSRPEGSLGAFDGWSGATSLDAAARELGIDDAAAHRSVELVRALLVAHPGSLSHHPAGSRGDAVDVAGLAGAGSPPSGHRVARMAGRRLRGAGGLR